ncbi:DUF389 domain-containing protein [Klenkia taihuensis]|uniref:Uncharacterized hydrophobic domain-containing protein n=1 Tax=Klenkia taihuensis TaxID=1225127 RepID=A0A1I1IFK9_9ACTN|nr:DUF389 domain-containing protein [Klenkia taihuensis]GHE08669.1 membrane protein [Klenkia taihuensis]SFC34452.1 uncharacterized hydrophobic domain-containing protein [Klenkia taihuensis]
MLLHLRITVPADRADEVHALLDDHVGVTHLVHLRGAVRRPDGDLVMCDVARESVDHLVDELQRHGVDEDGGIAIESVDTSLSAASERAEQDAPGDGADAVVWDQVVATADEESRLTWTFCAFLTIACLLAALAIITDSAVLLIGGMVMGPEFSPLAGIALGLVHRNRLVIRHSLTSLGVGFAVATVLTVGFALLLRWWGWADVSDLLAERPATGFITRPDRWSFPVAFIAGVAGMLALTSSKSASLVGVFISVTTVPAVAALALGIAFGDWTDSARSLLQLGINVVGIMLAAVLTLLALKGLWRRVPRSVPRRLGEAG